MLLQNKDFAGINICLNIYYNLILIKNGWYQLFKVLLEVLAVS